MQRVFISYSRRNKTFAERLARDLSDAGLDVWIDFRQIHAGEKWRDEIFRGLERSEIVIVALSPDAVASEWVQTEANAAREMDKFIVPVMAVQSFAELRQTPEIGWLLDLQFIEFQGRYEEAFPELLTALPGRRRVGPYNPADVANITNPFKGLEAFQQTDAAFFFGREALIEKALQRLREDRATRFLAVVGASGSGKSSLVRAGVIPALRRGELPGSEQWRMAIFTPGDQPVDALARRLAPLIAARETHEVYALLEETSEYFEPLVMQALADASPTARLLLVVDQFEEVFTRAGEAQRLMFIEILRQAVTRSEGRAHVLITMRADFFDRLSHYPALAELFEQENMVIVTEMSAPELLRAIEGPAEAVGLVYDPGLPQRILEDVQKEPGSLPLLQYALKELFERRQGNRLTREAYHEIGGVRQALARHAEQVYTGLGLAQQAIMRRILLRLIEVSETGEATRRKVPRSELVFRDVPHEAVQEVIDLLTSAHSRLLIASREIKSADETTAPIIWIEIGHEALIREWERFNNWVHEDLEHLRYGSELMQSARDWRQRGGEASYLLTGSRLTRAELWMQEGDPTQLQREFIQASLQAREHREEERQRQIERELRLQRRATQRLRLIAVVLVVGLVVAAGLAAVAIRNQQVANEAQSRAEANEQQALVNEQRARSLALASGANRALGDGDTELAVLLAVEASLIENAPPQSSRTLSEVGYAPGTRAVFQGHNADVRAVAFDPVALQALSAARNTLVLWQFSTGQVSVSEVRRFGGRGGHANNINALAFRPGTSGTQAMSAGDDGIMILWDVTTGTAIRRFENGHTGSISDIAFSPDGSRVISGGADEQVILWDVETGAVINPFQNGAAVNAVVFIEPTSTQPQRVVAGLANGRIMVWNPLTYELANTHLPAASPDGGEVRIISLGANPTDATRLLVGLADGRALILNLENLEAAPLREFQSDSGTDVVDVAYSPDAEEVTLGLGTGELQVWDVASETLRLVLDGHDDDVMDVDYGAAGRFIVSASRDDSVRVWDTRDGSVVAVYAGHDGSHTVVGVYGPDGRTILSGSSDPTDGNGDYSLRLWSMETQLTIQEFIGHTAAVTDVGLNADGSRAISSSRDGSVILWDVATGQPVHVMTLPDVDQRGVSFETVEFIPGSARAIAGTANGEVVIWNLDTGQPSVDPFPPATSKREPGHLGSVNAIAVSPDGTQAVSGGQDQDLVLWDLTNEQFIRRLENGHTDIVLSVAYASDADHIVSGSVDTTLLLWDVDVTSATYSQPIRQFEGHDSVVSAVDFAPNGSSVVSASRDGTVRLWDASNGFELRRFSSDDSAIPRIVDFSDDGRTVLTGMDDSTLREWRVLTDRSDLIAWTLLNRYVRQATCRERQLFDIVPLCDAEGNQPVPREPFPLPTATPASDVPQLAVGGTATVNTDGGDNLLLRSVPDNADGDGNVVERLPDASTVTLVEGPLQAGGYTWWLVRAESGIEGWVVQSVPQDGLQTLIAN